VLRHILIAKEYLNVWVLPSQTVLSIITMSAVTAVNMDMVIVRHLILFVNTMSDMNTLMPVSKLVVIMKVRLG